MAILTDFSLNRLEDFTLSVSIIPPSAIGGNNIRFQVLKHFGGVSGIITKSVASGYNNASGINITSSGQGTFSVTMDSVNTSGLAYGNYAYAIEKLDSGSRTIISEGYIMLNPG